MKLLRLKIVSAATCGGLLDGLEILFRDSHSTQNPFEPLCFIGPNGSGKSQLLQIIVEIFQGLFHAIAPEEERAQGNASLQYEMEYLIWSHEEQRYERIRVSRLNALGAAKKSPLLLQRKVDAEWIDISLSTPESRKYVPSKVVGYTSGGNETLSLPFFISRSGYAADVRESALRQGDGDSSAVPDTRLMLIDYSTHLEVLVSNLLIGMHDARVALLREARLERLHSFRCVIRLAHPAVRKGNPKSRNSKRKGIQLTRELEQYLDQFSRCATCFDYDDKTETYTFDFLVDEQTQTAFRHFWSRALDLYASFHKFAMLNDLAIPKATRQRFDKETRTRRFAARLPEPQDEEKVFRFEQVALLATDGASAVDYVSLSDGEHQLTQLLGTFCMVSFSNVLFLLDEPESHFNPQWRIKFASRLLDMPTVDGSRRESIRQECILSTHAPFVPSDMPSERVFILSKATDSVRLKVRHPGIQTFGTPFDVILKECFDVQPPISSESRHEIAALMQSTDPEEIRAGMDRLGHSVQKALLADRLRQLKKENP